MCKDGMGLVDLALNRIIPMQPMWPEYYSWALSAFDLSDGSWDPAGKEPPYLGSMPCGKILMSAYLLTYALADDYRNQWHSRQDYLNATLAVDNSYHESQNYRFIQRGDTADSEATTHDEAGGDIDMHCPVFDMGGKSDDPVNRASVMVHESWHHWQQHHGYESDHLEGATDWYYFHTVKEFDFGWLWGFREDPINKHHLFHSPYQIQVEFDADIAEYSRSFIPVAVTDSARYYGNARISNRFKNSPGYRIGDPRPW